MLKTYGRGAYEFDFAAGKQLFIDLSNASYQKCVSIGYSFGGHFAAKHERNLPYR